MVFKGFASNTPRLQCYDDQGVLPPQARNYFVGMGSEYFEEISPVGSVCGACVLFTSLEGKEAIGIVTHKMERNWHLSGALFEELRFNPLGDQIMKAQVVECPDEFVQ